MREIVLVVTSALLGYIVFSAISTSATPKEAFTKIMEQPQMNAQVTQELAFSKLHNSHEAELIALKNQENLEKLRTYEKLAMKEQESQTKVRIKQLDNQLNQEIATLEVNAKSEDKSKDNATVIVIALFLFLLLYIYLRHQKQLSQIELEKEERYNEMMAKKEYAERILAHISTGNLSFETEQKLLSVLDELNGKAIPQMNSEKLYHPNPDIIQLPTSK